MDIKYWGTEYPISEYPVFVPMVKYIDLKDLEVYKESLEIGNIAWEMYEKLDWQVKKIWGDQFIRSIDSIGANIAEGYGRFHYLDRIRFYYNARASLLEAIHWLRLAHQRVLAEEERCERLAKKLKELNHSLNSYISSVYKTKDKNA